MAADDAQTVRIDKWLWAARFYKTRSIARQMIEGGKVDYNGARAKPSRTVEPGAIIRLLQGSERREVEVLALSSVRGPAKEAQLLYRETAESLRRREQLQQMIRTLREPYGSVATMYLLEHKPVPVIAQALGRPEKTVQNQIFRAKVILRKQIEERRQT